MSPEKWLKGSSTSEVPAPAQAEASGSDTIEKREDERNLKGVEKEGKRGKKGRREETVKEQRSDEGRVKRLAR